MMTAMERVGFTQSYMYKVGGCWAVALYLGLGPGLVGPGLVGPLVFHLSILGMETACIQAKPIIDLEVLRSFQKGIMCFMLKALVMLRGISRFK